MKIAYDEHIFRLQAYGGISRYFCEIASRIASQADDVRVSITAPMHINAYLKHVPPGIVSGFRAPQGKLLRSPRWRLAMKGAAVVLGELMLRTSAPDIVHETFFSRHRPGPGRARRVLTIYDMIHEKFSPNFHQLDKTARNKSLAAARADHIICISESTRRDAIEMLQLPPERTSVIHLGFDLMHPADASDQDASSPAKRPFLLYVGTRDGHKNFSGLLAAYAASPRLTGEYDFICFGGGPFQSHEHAQIRVLGLDSGRVVQLGGDDAMLARLYKEARAFVYPSLYEGFGIPPLEAMAHGCPVVCSNTSSIPEVVGDAGEYFAPTEIDSMRTAIERVTDSDTCRTRLIELGHQRLKAFSWDRCAAETLGVYRQLI